MIDDDVLDMSEVLEEWSRPTTIKTVVKDSEDFKPQNTVTARTQDCVVQNAKKDKLNPATVNWSLNYIMVHSASDLSIGEFILHRGEDYKIVEDATQDGYGYCEVIAAQTKKPLLEVTP